MNIKESNAILVYKFLKKHPLAVISTISDHGRSPESSLIAFAETKSIELLFQTMCDSRKYTNLIRNPHVSVVVGWDKYHHVTLQYEGIAKHLTGSEAFSAKIAILKKKTPCTEEYINDPRARVFKITPTWLSFNDYTGKNPKISALTL